jgi:spermidine/putrescine-binding protein
MTAAPFCGRAGPAGSAVSPLSFEGSPMKRRTKLLGLLVTLITLTFAGAACGTSGSSQSDGTATNPKGTVTLFAYSDSFVPSIINPLKKKYPDLTIKSAQFNSQDEMVTKLRAGFQPDVIFACETDTKRLVAGGLVQPIDTSRVNAWNSLFPYFKNSPDIRENGKVYVMPNIGGTTGILYNPSKIPGGVTSYKQLLTDPALKGKVSVEDNAKYSIAMGALALGIKHPYDLTNADLQRVKAWFIAHKSNIKAFFSGDSDFLNLFHSGEITAGFGYKGYDTILSSEHVPNVYLTASEGALTWTCGYSIGRHATNMNAVYALLNWYVSPRVQAIYARTYTEIVTDQATLPLLPKSLVSAIGLSDPAQLAAKGIPTQVPSNYDQWLNVWAEIKAAS